MNLSIPTLLVATYAVYREGNIQKIIQRHKSGEILYLKLIDIKFRVLVYVLNTGIALYNYISGFDDYLMAGLLILSLHMVTSISKIVVEREQLIIGNTKIRRENFALVALKPLDDKNGKFTFEMMIKGRRLQKSLFLPLDQIEPLSIALKVFTAGGKK